MATIAIGIGLACWLSASTWLGSYTARRLPEHHLAAETQDTVKLCLGFIASLTALVLGLVVASSKDVHDEQDAAVKQMAVNTLALDRMLAGLGADAMPLRQSIRSLLARRINQFWPEQSIDQPEEKARDDYHLNSLEDVIAAVHELSAEGRKQQWYRDQALGYLATLGTTRWFALGAKDSLLPKVFVPVVGLWLGVLFFGFGLLAPGNKTAFAALFACSLCFACAMCLILELDQPLDGILKVSPAPLHFAVANIGQ